MYCNCILHLFFILFTKAMSHVIPHYPNLSALELLQDAPAWSEGWSLILDGILQTRLFVVITLFNWHKYALLTCTMVPVVPI